MHKYLRAIGFSSILKREDEDELLKRVGREYTYSDAFDTEHGKVGEIRTSIAKGVGLVICGCYDSNNVFHVDFYYPYAENENVTSTAYCEADRKVDQNAFSCLCEDSRLGVSLIFHMANSMEYMKQKEKINDYPDIASCSLAAFSVSGKILLPIMKTEKSIKAAENFKHSRQILVDAARQGDDLAMQSLTMQDVAAISHISRKIMSDRVDLYTVIDSFFMPYGVDSDEYTVMGTIKSVEKLKNKWSGECIYRLYLECNDMLFPVILNEKDLQGIPEVGRRFKGDVWMQGFVSIEDPGRAEERK